MSELKEECAIVGYYSINGDQPFIKKCIDSLDALQHRGRESSGISFINSNNEWGLYKGNGLVKDIYSKYNNDENFKSIIGHNRYSTSGKKHIMYENDGVNEYQICQSQIQPFYSIKHNFSMVHNGNIQKISYEQNDSRYILNFIEDYIDKGHSMKNILTKLLQTIKGIYNLIIQNEDGLYILRDRFGVRPFFYCNLDFNTIICGSETCGFGENTTNIKELEPGELLYIGEKENIIPYKTKSQKVIHKLYKLEANKINKSFCIFEYFYFMKHNSKIDNNTLYDIRFKLGSRLARNDVGKNMLFSKEDTIVVGSPNSGIAAGEGYALFSGFTYVQCIEKKKDVGRTFILPNDEERKNACSKAFNIYKDSITDKNIIIVDDTIVRGNTFKTLIEQIKSVGNPKSIHVRIASPQIVDRCNLGIDLPTKEELVVHKTDDICNYLSTNSILFLNLEEIKEVLGENICTKICGCFKGGKNYNDW